MSDYDDLKAENERLRQRADELGGRPRAASAVEQLERLQSSCRSSSSAHPDPDRPHRHRAVLELRHLPHRIDKGPTRLAVGMPVVTRRTRRPAGAGQPHPVGGAARHRPRLHHRRAPGQHPGHRPGSRRRGLEPLRGRPGHRRRRPGRTRRGGADQRTRRLGHAQGHPDRPGRQGPTPTRTPACSCCWSTTRSTSPSSTSSRCSVDAAAVTGPAARRP